MAKKMYMHKLAGLIRARSALILSALLTLVVVHDAALAVNSNGTLTIGRPSESETLDPHKSGRLVTSHVMNMVYDTLVAVSPDMTSVVPLLAESWDVSADGKTYTFRLRRDVAFHSGDPLNAEAVKFTFDRWLDPATKSPSTNYVRGVESVEAVDANTVRIVLESPNADFLYNIAIGWAGILNPTSVKAAGADYGSSKVDGTGPFKFVEWKRGQSLTMERNPAYRWGPSFYDNRGPARLEKVVWQMIPEAATRALELETGGINMLYSVPLADAERLAADPGITVIDYAFGFTIPIQFNLDHEITSDVNVRRAVAHAIDRQELATAVYYGYAKPAVGPLASTFPEYWSGIESVEYEFNPGKAEALLDQAGWKKGPDGIRTKGGKPLKIAQYLGGGYGFQEMFTIIQARLRQVGIQMDLNILEWASVYGHFRAGDHDAATRWMIYSTPQNLFQQYYYSASAPLPNSSMYKNPEADRLIDELARSSDPRERKALVEDLLKIVMRDLPVLPLTWQQEVVAMSNSVKDFEPMPVHGAGFYKLLDTWTE